MTQQARAVLSACEQALTELEADPPHELWKLRWFTAVALLRCVGHALKNVDRVSGEASIKTAIDDAWSRWQADKSANAIFWDFIEEERNRALKEFTFGAGRGVVIEPPTGRFVRGREGKWIHVNPDEEGRSWHTYTITKGPFTGQDQRAVVRQSIQWWEEQLDQIDQEASSIGFNPN
jgi:hypothetical protein